MTFKIKKQQTIALLTVLNVIFFVALMIVSLHYQVPQKVLWKMNLTAKKTVTNSTYYDMRNSLFSVYKKDSIKIVMLGNSITAGVEWNELLGRGDIANRGIGGDITEGFINRLPDIYGLNPKICFIMGGINDIGRGLPVDVIVENMRTIVENLNSHGIKTVIQSTLYISKQADPKKKRNAAVDELNKHLKEICAEKGLLFLDVNQTLSSDGALDEKYTYDGVHLLGSGYEKWRDLLVSVLKNTPLN
ncbi:MAG: GDSL-type esterase/lipase family protein [Prevotellaceae bacterium]|jgi:lysophospholipase L1-like esterase|nr:GDSL-type esterase/lipase family protein [Prevotellaceae bacterium]